VKPWLASIVALALAACASVESRAPANLDDIARDYVRLVLEIDAHEPGYVDAFFGPSEWRDEARKNPRGRPDLKREADRLKAPSIRLIRKWRSVREFCSPMFPARASVST
jgi:hypothetical protein